MKQIVLTLAALLLTTLVCLAQRPPETSAGWQKFEGNPIIGGKHGTCFDVSVLREGGPGGSRFASR